MSGEKMIERKNYKWMFLGELPDTDEKFKEAVFQGIKKTREEWRSFYADATKNGVMTFFLSSPKTDFRTILNLPPTAWMTPPVYRDRSSDGYDIDFVSNPLAQKRVELLKLTKTFGFGVTVETSSDLTESDEDEIKRAQIVQSIQKRCEEFTAKEGYKHNIDILNEYMLDFGYCGILFNHDAQRGDEMKVISPEQVFWDIKACGLYKEDAQGCGFTERYTVSQVLSMYQATEHHDAVEKFVTQYIVDRISKNETPVAFQSMLITLYNYYTVRHLTIKDALEQIIIDFCTYDGKPIEECAKYIRGLRAKGYAQLKVEDFSPLIDPLLQYADRAEPKFKEELLNNIKTLDRAISQIMEAINSKKPIQRIYHFVAMENLKHPKETFKGSRYCIIPSKKSLYDHPLIFCGQARRLQLPFSAELDDDRGNGEVFRSGAHYGAAEILDTILAPAIPWFKKYVENEIQLLAEKRANPQLLVVKANVIEHADKSMTVESPVSDLSAREQFLTFSRASGVNGEPVQSSLQIVEIRDRLQFLLQNRAILLEELNNLVPVSPRDYQDPNDPQSNLSFITKLHESMKVVQKLLDPTINALNYFFNLLKKSFDESLDSAAYKINLKISGGTEFQSAQDVQSLIACLPYLQNDPSLTQAAITAMFEASQNPVYANIIKLLQAKTPDDDKALIEGRITVKEYQVAKQEQAQANPPQPSPEEQLVQLETQRVQLQAEQKARELDLKELEVSAKVQKMGSETIRTETLTPAEEANLKADTESKKSAMSAEEKDRIFKDAQKRLGVKKNAK